MSSELSQNGKTIKAEIRSLNSKFLDLNLRLPFSFKDKEIEVRGLVTEKVQRGKIDLFISIETGADEKNIAINKKGALNNRAPFFTKLACLLPKSVRAILIQ